MAAVTIDSDTCTANDIDATIAALIAAASIGTYYNTVVEKIGDDNFYVAIVYLSS